MSLPRMPLHVGDYLKETTHLDATLHGAYVLLIIDYWVKGSLPDDDVQLARIARTSNSSKVLLRRMATRADGEGDRRG